MIRHPHCPFHGNNPVQTWTTTTRCVCIEQTIRVARLLRDLSEWCHNGAGAPWQEFYDHGAAPILERMADRLEAGK